MGVSYSAVVWQMGVPSTRHAIDTVHWRREVAFSLSCSLARRNAVRGGFKKITTGKIHTHTETHVLVERVSASERSMICKRGRAMVVGEQASEVRGRGGEENE